MTTKKNPDTKLVAEVTQDTIDKREKARIERRRKEIEHRVNVLLGEISSVEAALKHAKENVDRYTTRVHELYHKLEQAKTGDEEALKLPSYERTRCYPTPPNFFEIAELHRWKPF